MIGRRADLRMAVRRGGAGLRRTLLAGLASTFACGCSSGDGAKSELHVGVGADGALTAVFSSGACLTVEPDSEGLDATTGHLAIAGAIGETVAFGLRLRATGGGFDALDLSIGPLTSGRGDVFPASFDVYRVHGVSVERRRGWQVRFVPGSRRRSVIDDIVVPRWAEAGGLPARTAAQDRLHVWAEVEIPRGTEPETYVADVIVTNGARTLMNIPLRFTVRPVTLTAAAGVELLAPVNVGALPGDGSASYLSSVVEMLRSHGVHPVLEGVHPVAKVDGNGRLSVDWTAFDRAVGVFLDDGRGAWCRIPFDAGFPAGALSENGGAGSASSLATAYLRACAEHFASRGWLRRSFVQVPVPARGHGDGLEAIRRLAGPARLADRRLVTLVTFDCVDAALDGWPAVASAGVDKLIDIWCPPGRWATDTAEAGAGPETTWLGEDRPPHSGTTGVVGERSAAWILPWQARRYGLPRVLLGTGRADGASRGREATDEDRLWYDGGRFGMSGPVASMRLKHLRRGMEDLAYLSLLDAQGLRGTTKKLMDLLSPYALSEAYGYHAGDARGVGWSMADGVWSLARRIMVEEAAARSGGGDEAAVTATDRAVWWRRLSAETGRVRMVAEGVRIGSGSRAGEVRVECMVLLENRTTVPVGGRLAFGALPVGWRASGDPPRVAPMGPLERRRVVLVAHSDSLSWDADGVIELPIVFRTERGDTHTTVARACYIVSQRRSSSLSIDGELSDWPAGSGNTAAGFVPISGPPADAEAGPSSTRCMVSHDASRLYFAVHCAVPPREPRTVVQRNSVEYEDMIPMGESLVEILIDPTNAGTYAPEDLYHIVITAGGAVFERGIGCTPPVGPRRVWGADVQYASRREGRSWVIEVSVPLNAFESSGGPVRIWGLNFARFERDRGVYSTWSGVLYNAYVPISLGNMMLP